MPKGPSYDPKHKRLAVQVEDHPYEYKDFEGTIPQGEYGGGTVMLWDEGTWEEQEAEPFAEGLNKGALKFILHGRRLRGKWTLIKIKPRPGEDDKNWLLIKEKDEYQQDNEGVSSFQTSIRSERSMEEIASSFSQEPVEVQLATLTERAPRGKDWLYELKYDGYRIVAYLEGEKVRLLSRNHQDYTDKFPEVANELASFKSQAVLDGEMVVMEAERSDFQALQKYIKTKKGPRPIFMVFDLLQEAGVDLRGRPLAERRNILEKFMQNKKSSYVVFSRALEGDPEDVLKTVCDGGMEGIIAKTRQKAYTAGRSKDWFKIKCRNEQEFIIGGFSRTDKRNKAFSSLLLGVKEGEDIRYVGRVGTGFSEGTTKELLSRFQPLMRKTSPLLEVPKARSDEEITWLSPKLIAQVNFTEWTDQGLLRHASFLGLREDKTADEVVLEQKEDIPVVLTSPDKEMFPGISKQEVHDYYAWAVKRMLPYIKNRLLSLVRCPDGIDRECFFQKHLSQEWNRLFNLDITENDGDRSDGFYLEDSTGLMQAVQYGTIELHLWGSRTDQLEKPDIMVFDLDPDEGMGLAKVRQGVLDLKSILDELKLESFLKTSGGKGYHVLIPLKPIAGWDDVREFSKNIALLMEQKWPDKYTANMRKEKRKGKIYVDWVRNGRGATSVAPYSLRARQGAPISWPIAWKDLNKIAPADVTLENINGFEANDPWAEFFSIEQAITSSR